jgi:argininosuccinate lyase
VVVVVAAVAVVADVVGAAVAAVVVVAAAVVAFPFLVVAYPRDYQEVPFHHILHCHTLLDSLEEASQMVEALQSGEEGHQRVACQEVVLASC